MVNLVLIGLAFVWASMLALAGLAVFIYFARKK